MINKADLDTPALLHHERADEGDQVEKLDRSKAREFPTLREALHHAMTEEPPAGKVAIIQTSSGALLKPGQLEEIWTSLQGP